MFLHSLNCTGRCDAFVHGTCRSVVDGRAGYSPFEPAAERVHKDDGEDPHGDSVLEDREINWWQLTKKRPQSRDALNAACSPKKTATAFFVLHFLHSLTSTSLPASPASFIMAAPPPLRVQINGILLSTLLFECANARVDYVRCLHPWSPNPTPHQEQCPTPRRVCPCTAT